MIVIFIFLGFIFKSKIIIKIFFISKSKIFRIHVKKLIFAILRANFLNFYIFVSRIFIIYSRCINNSRILKLIIYLNIILVNFSKVLFY